MTDAQRSEDGDTRRANGSSPRSSAWSSTALRSVSRGLIFVLCAPVIGLALASAGYAYVSSMPPLPRAPGSTIESISGGIRVKKPPAGAVAAHRAKAEAHGRSVAIAATLPIATFGVLMSIGAWRVTAGSLRHTRAAVSSNLWRWGALGATKVTVIAAYGAAYEPSMGTVAAFLAAFAVCPVVWFAMVHVLRTVALEIAPSGKSFRGLNVIVCVGVAVLIAAGVMGLGIGTASWLLWVVITGSSIIAIGLVVWIAQCFLLSCAVVRALRQTARRERSSRRKAADKSKTLRRMLD